MGDFIEVGGHYTYKGITYEVKQYDPGVFKMKDPSDGNWHDAVEYYPLEGDAAHMTFVRQADDFRNKFDSIPPVEAA